MLKLDDRDLKILTILSREGRISKGAFTPDALRRIGRR